MKIQSEASLRDVFFLNSEERNTHITVSKHYLESALQTCISKEFNGEH